LLFDADKAGREGAIKAAELLTKAGILTEIADPWPDRNDGFDIADYYHQLHPL